nr:disks large-associated protein 5-like [Equus asinus]
MFEQHNLVKDKLLKRKCPTRKQVGVLAAGATSAASAGAAFAALATRAARDCVLNKNETTTENLHGFPINEVPSLEINEDQTSQQQHVLCFRKILRYESEELILTDCLEWERKFEGYIPNKDTGPAPEIQQSDHTCGWEKASNTSKDVFQEKVVSGIASGPKQDDAGIADGGHLTAVKKAVRERMQPGEQAEALGSAVPKEVDLIAFDAGSFRIESPVKSSSDIILLCIANNDSPVVLTEVRVKVEGDIMPSLEISSKPVLNQRPVLVI